MRVTVHRAGWSEDVARVFAPVLTDRLYTVEDHAAEIRAGDVALREVRRAATGERLGWFSCRIREAARGTEFVVMVAAGYAPEGGLVELLTPFFEQVAREIGAARVVMHTARPGLERVLSGLGYSRAEIVMVKEV